MKRLDLDEATLRGLIEQFPLYQIAERYDCDARRIGALAREYGLNSGFIARPASEDEVAALRRLADEGWSVKRIATHLGRSQDCQFASNRDPSFASNNDPLGGARLGLSA